MTRLLESWHDIHAEALVELERESKLLVLAVKHMQQDRDMRDLRPVLARAIELTERISGRLDEL